MIEKKINASGLLRIIFILSHPKFRLYKVVWYKKNTCVEI